MLWLSYHGKGCKGLELLQATASAVRCGPASFQSSCCLTVCTFLLTHFFPSCAISPYIIPASHRMHNSNMPGQNPLGALLMQTSGAAWRATHQSAGNLNEFLKVSKKQGVVAGRFTLQMLQAIASEDPWFPTAPAVSPSAQMLTPLSEAWDPSVARTSPPHPPMLLEVHCIFTPIPNCLQWAQAFSQLAIPTAGRRQAYHDSGLVLTCYHTVGICVSARSASKYLNLNLPTGLFLVLRTQESFHVWQGKGGKNGWGNFLFCFIRAWLWVHIHQSYYIPYQKRKSFLFKVDVQHHHLLR